MNQPRDTTQEVMYLTRDKLKQSENPALRVCETRIQQIWTSDGLLQIQLA